MIYGFAVNGSDYGLFTYPEASDDEVGSALADELGLPVEAIELLDAEDLINEQYDGLAFLTTERP